LRGGRGKAKAPPERGFYGTLSAGFTRHACQAISA
jgi:hypothetical protein